MGDKHEHKARRPVATVQVQWIQVLFMRPVRHHRVFHRIMNSALRLF